MNPTREEALFAAALERPPAERAPFVDGACLGDAALRQRVEALLIAHDATTNPLHTEATLEVPVSDIPDEAVGQTLGRYKLLEKVGEGGCGVVYVAEQTEPVRRRVALKVIKLGMDTRQVVARFEAERQALAMMDHPNIAKVLDAGTTEQGRPFFVMELVRGIRITDYCDQASLDTQDRLELFIKVCQAIQHAHQKGIIHRDIKPSNILVTLHDGVAVPKVIDFGIAKATEGRLTEATVYTQLHQFIGTPAYMSPEQAEMSGLDIDTRSDIYSLGVLLYELLAGSTPFDGKELMASGIDAMRKTIREKEPPRPSTRLATLGADQLTTAAKRRSVDTSKLLHQLKGDLDWIVMKCLEKDRQRRYETANGLATDIRRHLDNEPVTARPPSAAYKLQKAFRRNRLIFTAGAAVLAALLAGISVSVWQATQATRARNQAAAERDAKEQARLDAEAIATFLTEIFQSPSPERGGRTITVAEMLDGAAQRLETDLASQPGRRARLQAAIGDSYEALGLVREAIPLLEKVRDHHLASGGPDHPETLTAMHALARAHARGGRFSEAIAMEEQVLAKRQSLLGPEHPDTLASMHALASAWFVVRPRDSLRLKEQVLPLRRKVLGPEHLDTLVSMNNLAVAYASFGRKEEALRLREEVHALSQKRFGPEHRLTFYAMLNLASSYADSGRREEALGLREKAALLRAKVLGPEHPLTLMATLELTDSYIDLGRQGEAITLREELVQRLRKAAGPRNALTLRAMGKVADSYANAGRREEALRLRENVLEQLEQELGPEAPLTLEAMVALANSHAAAGRHDEAIRHAERALATQRRLLVPGHPELIKTLNALVVSLRAKNEIPRAAALEREISETRLDTAAPPP